MNQVNGSNNELNFNWRYGDYALEACPARLVRLSDNEPNTTIDFVKYYRQGNKEYKYSIGYFYYNTNEPCWELKFVGDRFTEIFDTDVAAVFRMLKAAYETLTEWSERREQ